MTLVKKQALIRTITMSIVLILYWLAICFINNQLLFGIFCISMAVISIVRMYISRQFRTKSDKGTLTLSFMHSYPIGDEREQYLMLNAGYIAGQVIVIFVFVLTVVLALTNAIKFMMVPIPEIMALIIGIIIVHEWLVIGIYWYLDAKY